MANFNVPHGFVPVGHVDGSDWNGKTSQYYVPQTDLIQYCVGDVVASVPGAAVGIVLGVDVTGMSQVVRATPGANARGVIVSMEADPLDLNTRRLPATKLRSYIVNVADDPDVVFAVQGDNVVTLAATAVGSYANYTVAQPTAVQGVSVEQVATASIANNAGLSLHILGLENGDFTAFTQFLVVLNLHDLG